MAVFDNGSGDFQVKRTRGLETPGNPFWFRIDMRAGGENVSVDGLTKGDLQVIRRAVNQALREARP
ncbi:hypothetical protein OZX72_02945 [Bifidobacterium sp. ESL0769]|uniref:hypothetical protein n=1 Tax=Bifidobacterium sp. ESL0769 TaxID=2983229 RepID=UPI0023F83563|nr:hypothetical protein [Bifidobacterium sp. ESL0769]WEV67956.1 hypothetical protein OZX72_02945 [Bifidobacterium sp. ESL0769]